jgi:hypothetical protein
MGKTFFLKNKLKFPNDIKKIYFKAIDLIEKSYFFIKLGDFLSGLYQNTKLYYEEQNKGKGNVLNFPNKNYQINNMMDIYDKLEDDLFGCHFYLVRIRKLIK